MFKAICTMLLALSLGGCSSAQKSAHHHHEGPEFEGNCTYSVAHGKHEVKGKEEFQLKHDGKTYFFSSGDLRDHFSNEIESNIKAAEKKWIQRMERGSQR